MKIASSAFDHNQPIPKRYTVEGPDVSPPLSFSNLPEGTTTLALICDDPDAPSEEPWVHWVIYNIPANITVLSEGIARSLTLIDPPDAIQGMNTWPTNNIGYRGPAPPPGHGVHHYHFTLYALDTAQKFEQGFDKQLLLETMQGHILAQAQLIGTYQR